MKKINILLLITLLTIACITPVYAALNQEMIINGEAYVRVDADIRITNVTMESTENGAIATYKPNYSKNTSNIYATLPASSKIIFTVEVTNKSSDKYYLEELTEYSNTNQNITIEKTVNEEDIYNANSTSTFTITLTNETSNEEEITLIYEYSFSVLDIKSVTIGDRPKNDTISEGGEVTLSTVIKPSVAPNKTITWSSSDTDVATIDSDGKVTGVIAGKTTITATAVNGMTDSFELTVKGFTIGTVISGDGTNVGDIVQIGDDANDQFYVIGTDGDNTKLLARGCLSKADNLSQFKNSVYKVFSCEWDLTFVLVSKFMKSYYWMNKERNYPGSYSGNPYLYVYDENSLVYSYVEAYIDKLKEATKSTNISGRVPNYEEVVSLPSDILSAYKGRWWTGSAKSISDNYYFYETAIKTENGISNSEPIRPLILIPSNLIG